MGRIIDSSLEAFSYSLDEAPPMAAPRTVLLCPPDHFDIVDVKNPFMEGQSVDRGLAAAQWRGFVGALEASGLEPETLPPLPECEDMVFTANQTLTAPGAAVLANMRHESRQREVTAFAEWLAERDVELHRLPEGIGFEGSGDALWHPGRRLLWGASARARMPPPTTTSASCSTPTSCCCRFATAASTTWTRA